MSTGGNPGRSTPQAPEHLELRLRRYYRVATSGDPGQTRHHHRDRLNSAGRDVGSSIAMAAYTGAEHHHPHRLSRSGTTRRAQAAAPAPSGNTATRRATGDRLPRERDRRDQRLPRLPGITHPRPAGRTSSIVRPIGCGLWNDSNGHRGLRRGRASAAARGRSAGNTQLDWWSLFTIGLAVASAPSTNADAVSIDHRARPAPRVAPQAAVAANARPRTRHRTARAARAGIQRRRGTPRQRRTGHRAAALGGHQRPRRPRHRDPGRALNAPLLRVSA